MESTFVGYARPQREGKAKRLEEFGSATTIGCRSRFMADESEKWLNYYSLRRFPATSIQIVMAPGYKQKEIHQAERVAYSTELGHEIRTKSP